MRKSLSKTPLPCYCGLPGCRLVIADEWLLSPSRLLRAACTWWYFAKDGENVGFLHSLLDYRREPARYAAHGDRYGKASLAQALHALCGQLVHHAVPSPPLSSDRREDVWERSG